jgi:PncC family amidohydrolase
MSKDIALQLAETLMSHKKTISVAESCTGGMVANLITNIPGSSIYFLGGIVSYSNQAKIDLLKVSESLIQTEGAVSRSCAITMAQNIRLMFHSDLGVGITGVAGPGGGSSEKPIGSVYMAIADGEKTVCKLFKFSGERIEIKQQASATVIKMAKEFLQKLQ